MSKLFESTEINGMKLANRFVRSATWEGMAADDGAVTPKLTQTMVNLVEGGVGLIISGHAYVCKEGQAGPWQLGIYKDELVDGLKTMTDAVHQAGDHRRQVERRQDEVEAVEARPRAAPVSVRVRFHRTLPCPPGRPRSRALATTLE